MFRAATMQNTRKARPALGQVIPVTIPTRGLNARDAFAVMNPQYAISLTNVTVEDFGIKTRKGYTEWALGIPGVGPVWTVMSYYPAPTVPVAKTFARRELSLVARMLRAPVAEAIAPAGKLFAARGGFIYDVTAGGAGPWVAEAGVGIPGGIAFWTWLNFQNAAGSFLLACNQIGGYAVYNGAWTMPVAGAGVGQINGADPSKFCFVTEWKKRLWFIEFNSTRAWYLPVGQITGTVKEFNFGEQFRRGGKLVALVNWTVDGGEGVDDYLVAVSSQGAVVVYKGTDPDTVGDFQLHGVWNVGPLPVGHRAVVMTGGDVHILSQFGVTPLTSLINSPILGEIDQKRESYVIAPLIAHLMQAYDTFDGWQIQTLPSEELLAINVPPTALENPGDMFALKVTSGAWSMFKAMPYTSFVSIDSSIFAGTNDGRVVRAFDGTLDNVTRAAPTTSGQPIQCQVTPAYQAMGAPGLQKRVPLIRPTFLASAKPTVSVTMLFDYGLPVSPVTPSIPLPPPESSWGSAIWGTALWGAPLGQEMRQWIGTRGSGFVATAQLDYRCTRETLLTSIDYWAEPGGVM
jgi:hypothetical protein